MVYQFVDYITQSCCSCIYTASKVLNKPAKLFNISDNKMYFIWCS